MVTITINDKKKGAKEFLDFAKNLPYAEVSESTNKATLSTITVIEKTEVTKEFLKFVKHLSYAKVYDENKKPNFRTRRAIKQADRGKNIYRTKNYKDLLEQLDK